eukprot:TRINITY_DN656_c0_g1_i1.p1 TRINITY_DN656_c0_g1~~TRINITY_DN656_c0_g1_i1.p1  ORF type:complete len:245 (+),score=58.52 TRINITY_DN656_c0_g1_i1:304-1038(+)
MNSHSQKTFSYINVLASPYSWTDGVSTDGVNPTFQSIINSHPFSINLPDGEWTTNSLQDFYRHIEKVVENHIKNDLSCCLMIDNINYLLNCVHSPLVLIDFIHYCKLLINNCKKGSSFIFLYHSDSDDNDNNNHNNNDEEHDDDDDDDHNIFYNLLKYKSTIIMKVDSLQSGYSTDIDGELSFYTTHNYIPTTRTPTTTTTISSTTLSPSLTTTKNHHRHHRFHFKLTDNIQLIPVVHKKNNKM